VSQTNLASFGIEEYLGDNAADIIHDAEKVSDFVTRVVTGFHQGMDAAVSNARFTNSEVGRYHTTRAPHIELAE
jgi:hypothetical protein